MKAAAADPAAGALLLRRALCKTGDVGLQIEHEYPEVLLEWLTLLRASKALVSSETKEIAGNDLYVSGDIRACMALLKWRMLWRNLCCGAVNVELSAGTVMLSARTASEAKDLFLLCSRQGCAARQTTPDIPAGIPGEWFASTAVTRGCCLL